MKKLFFSPVIILLTFVSCSKEEPDVISLSVSEKSLFYDDGYQIKAASKAAIKYVSENEYHAKVSETGLVTAGRVGETNILLSNGEDSKTFKVVVKPKSNLYTEPDVMFGDTKSSIIGKLGAPDSEIETAIGYFDYSNSVSLLMFSFDKSDKLTSYSVVVKIAYSSILADFLAERYQPTAEIDGDFVFINGLSMDAATKMIVVSLYNSSSVMVIYGPYTRDSQNKSAKSAIYSNAIGKMLQRLP